MKLTAPQRKVLQAVADGEVYRLRSTPRKLYPITPGISDAVLDQLFALALVQYDDGGEGHRVVGTYSLTDAGRTYLAASYRSELAIHATAHADREATTGHLIQVAIDAAIKETLTDLRERLMRDLGVAKKSRDDLPTDDPAWMHRAGKVDGIKLALSYLPAGEVRS